MASLSALELTTRNSHTASGTSWDFIAHIHSIKYIEIIFNSSQTLYKFNLELFNQIFQSIDYVWN